MSTTPVLVLGSEGMLGQACMQRLSTNAGLSVDGTRHSDSRNGLYFDALGDEAALDSILERGRYRFVINAIGVLKPAIRDSDPASVEAAVRINSLFPYQLSRLCARRSARLIHISTDGVFSGRTQDDYTEDCPADSQDSYGRSKLLGECLAGNVLNLRCSVVGRDRTGAKGLIEWFLHSVPGSKLPGYADFTWTPATTLQAAELCRLIVAHDAFDEIRRESALHHFAPNPPLTKYEFLTLLNAATGGGREILRVESPGGPVRRVLATRFQGIRRLCRGVAPWPDLLAETLSAGLVDL